MKELHYLIRTRFPFLAVMVLIGSCKTIQPAAPTETFSTSTFKPDLSEVNIPVNISISGMEASINNKVNGLLYEDNDLNDNGGDNLMLKVWKKDKITMDVVGDEVQYRLPLQIWLKTGFKITTFGLNLSEYKEGSCALALRFKSKVSVDSLWNVKIKTSSDGYDWISKPVIKLGAIDFPVTIIANQILKAQLPHLANAIDEHARENLHIKEFVEQTWTKLQEPILLSDTPQFWLAVHPVGVHMLPFAGKSGSISSAIGIHAYVQSQLGAKPSIPKSPLPRLELLSDMNNEVNISLVSDITYESATAFASEKLLNQTFTFNNGKQHVTILGIKIYPSHDKLVSKIELEGSVRGSVYLEGIPYYDPGSVSIRMKHTDFHVETKNALLKSASWLLHGSFIKRIEPMLTYPLADQLNHGKEILEQSLKENKITEHIWLDGQIEKLLPYQILLTPETIKTVVLARGRLAVKIDGFD